MGKPLLNRRSDTRFADSNLKSSERLHPIWHVIITDTVRDKVAVAVVVEEVVAANSAHVIRPEPSPARSPPTD
jgi:hypothetical protein